MPTANEKLISHEVPKPGIPLKKSTIVAVAALVAVLVGFSSLLLHDGGSKGAVAAPVAPKDAPPPTTGNASVIDEESRLAEMKVPDPSPVPPAVRRPNGSAALYEDQLSAMDMSGGPLGPGGPLAQDPNAAAKAQQAALDLEREAEVRLAKAVIFDSDGGAAAAPASLGVSASPFGPGVEALGSAGGLPSLPSGADRGAAALEAAINRAQLAQTGGGGGKSWMKEYAGDIQKKGSSSALKSTKSDIEFVLHQGKVIPAVLGRELNSDLPGRITAFTTVNIYDSLGRGHLLIPKGSVLDGQYDSEIKAGQSRMLFAFERLILPDGTSFDLPPAPGSDMRGAAGIEGNVNNHFFKMFISSFFVAVLADKTTMPSGQTNIGTSGPTTAAGQVLVDVSKSILERNRVIAPTITVPQGQRINVEVVSDMEFPGSYRTR